MLALIIAIVLIVVVIHYESLLWLTRLLAKMQTLQRMRLLIGVLAALCAHAVEVTVFAFAYYRLHHQGGGELIGNFDGSFPDCLYYSLTTFTTLGFGDIAPMGAMRYLTGAESLVGLVLITWTASFLFIEMQRHWRDR